MLVKRDEYSNESYSQEGEDMVLRNFFSEKNIKKGFYVDVGAHHPKRFSNTYYFYKRGWKGLNIDPRPDGMQLFNKIRPTDINLEFAIGNCEKELEYFMFEEPAYNSLDRELSETRINSGISKLIGKKKIRCISLESILDEFLPNDTMIDFMSIDVEGFDFEVLQSNNWNKYSPRVILVESLESEKTKNAIDEYLINLKYTNYACTGNTKIYIRCIKNTDSEN